MSCMAAKKISYASQALWLNMRFQYFSSPRLVPYENATSPRRSVITLNSVKFIICVLSVNEEGESKCGELALE